MTWGETGVSAADERLLIDRLAVAAERTPGAPFTADLSNSQAWARSGSVASWLIAQGYGPGGKALAAPSADPVLVLAALRAGARLDPSGVPLPAGLAVEALMRCSVDAAVAERRLHIAADTPALVRGDRTLAHKDIATLADAL